MELTFGRDVDVEMWIKDCQVNKHIQQVAYSTYHNCLTQVCFTCDCVRTSITEEEIKGRKMTELKTLKDIFEERKMYANDIISSIILEDLRAEAVKHHNKFTMKTKEGIEMSNVAGWIKLFFNLTEEEIKGEK